MPSIAHYVSFPQDKRTAGVETIVTMARDVLHAANFFLPNAVDPAS